MKSAYDTVRFIESLTVFSFMKPRITFQMDPLKDYSILQGFFHDAEFDGGRNLEWAVYQKYPELKQMLVDDGLSGKRTDLVVAYVKRYFNEHEDDIRLHMEMYKKAWSIKQDSFFRLTEKIFADRKWPEGEYVAYVTMWGMFPRSLEEKTFQIPALSEDVTYVTVIIAHEMLHFLFYEYLFEKHPELRKKEENFLTWNVSELFNAVVQNSQTWLNIFTSRSMTYPEHEAMEGHFRKTYSEVTSKNLEPLVEELISASMTIKPPKQ